MMSKIISRFTEKKVNDALPATQKAIACILKTLCRDTESLQNLGKTHAVWIALEEPGISIHDYAARLLKYMHCSNACIVISIIYIDRLIQMNSVIPVHPLTIHRLLLTVMVLAV